MEPIKTQDVYLLIKNEYANMIHDLITVQAIEKKENMICLTKEDFEKVIWKALHKGESICEDNALAFDKYGKVAGIEFNETKIAKEKQEYINLILNK